MVKKLSYKIFTAIFLTVITVTSMIFSLRYFLNRHFMDYVNQVEFEGHNTLITLLEKEYQKQQGWEGLKSNRRKWIETMMSAMRNLDMERTPNLDRDFRPDGLHPSGMESGMPPMSPFRPRMGMGQRLFLLDDHKSLIIGNLPPAHRYILQEIEVDGKIVGWLGFRKRETIENPIEMAFMRQQYFLLYLIGGGILAITLIVSILLARHLLEPIKKLKTGTQAIRSRKFDTRITVPSRDELGQLADDFNLMAQTLEKYETMRQQWMSDISHELRTPLAILRGEIEALQDGVREISPERIESLHAEIMHMSKMVNDLYELTLAETHTLSFRKEPISPPSVLDEALNSFESRLNERGIRICNELGSDKEATIMGDPDRLYQLFSNLFENVVRYADSPGNLKIWQEQHESYLKLYLEDTGPGVPEASLEHLFERFYRVDKSRSRSLGGSGLGLSICKGIMETMGGKIQAKNGPSGGLRIKLVFPLN